MNRSISSRWAVGVILFALVGCMFALVKRDFIYDWWRLHNYNPSVDISQLATQTTMTPDGRKLFYVNHPKLEKSTAFNKDCPPGSEHTIVLGCYHPVEDGIFLYTVNDPQLSGVEQVTAAHEMLHAAYDRLSKSERTYVDGLLENYYKTDLHDPTILAEIAAYKKSEPNAVVNEMHSVFGTEVSNLPKPLEAYYKRYFTDRKKIAAYAAAYRSAFSEREAKVKQYDVQLSTMKATINTDEASLTAQLQKLHSDKNQLDADKSSGNIAAYNAAVPEYNAEVDAYNTLAETVRGLIPQYNQIVSRRNAIALEENHLVQELSSTVKAVQQ
jgi:hypothetical protein